MNGGPRRAMLGWIGGVVACVVLLVAGIAYVVIGVQGRNEVRDTLKREQIVGTPDMKPGGIQTDVKVGTLPTCSVAGVAVDTGQRAKCFASYMRIHALESSNGQTYAQMGRYLDANGNQTNDEAKAAKNPETGRPVENAARNLWVTETALATGLNMSFFAEQVSLFAIVIGICVIMIAIGLGVLTVATWGFTPWRSGAAREVRGDEPVTA